MNANEIAWGIELETTLPASDPTRIGPYHHGTQVDWLPAGWKAERDGSIREGHGRRACEFVSPKLRGAEGLAQAMAAADEIRQRGGQVNETCGLHVTVEFTGNAETLARLISLVANHEKGIFASTGTTRRERITYARPIKTYGNHADAKRRCECDRYHLLNLTHLARGQQRIEFRAFAGTLNATKIAAYVMLCLGLVELAAAKTRCTAWSYAKKEATARSCWDRGAAGETEITRLFYRLGWTTGWYKGTDRHKRYGELAAADRPTPDWRAIKAKLWEMAQKYDRAAQAATTGHTANVG